MGILSKSDIFSARDIKTITVAVPEWGGEVLVKTLTGTERDNFEQSLIGDDRKVSMTDARARLCAASIVDEEGSRLFTDADIAALGQKSGKALDRVYSAASRVSGLTAADFEEMVKNSGMPGPQGDSTSS